MAGAATVEKALDVLFHLHDVGAPLGLSEIGRALDLPKSSCHRLLASLVDREVVERDAGGRYRPGLALLSLGMGAQSREPVVQAARPILESEAAALGETVFLVGQRHGRLRVLDKSEGSGFLRAAPGVGDLIPSDVTAAGQLYRVFGAAPESPQAAEAAHDADDANDAAESARILARGYALNRDAWIDGLSVLGVPVFALELGGGQRMVAALALAAASPRFEVLGEAQIAGRLLAAAEAVARRLGVGGARARALRQKGAGR